MGLIAGNGQVRKEVNLAERQKELVLDYVAAYAVKPETI
jgi:hypothetical protein